MTRAQHLLHKTARNLAPGMISKVLRQRHSIGLRGGQKWQRKSFAKTCVNSNNHFYLEHASSTLTFSFCLIVKLNLCVHYT